jgi:hypothetical protein
MKKENIYIILGIAAVVGYIYYKRKKAGKTFLAPATKIAYTAPNLNLAQDYFNKIQQLYGTVPSGGSLPKDVSDKVVTYMAEIEKAGFTVNDSNQLVKQVYNQ